MEDQDELGNNIQNEEEPDNELELNIAEMVDKRTDEEKRQSFKEKYRNPQKLPIVEEPKIYSKDQNGNLKSYLRPGDILKYTHYQKQKDKDFGKNNRFIVFPAMDDAKYGCSITNQIAELITKETKQKRGIIRKVLFCQRRNEAHIACVCLFIDKSTNKNTIIIPSYDVQFVKPPLQYNKNTYLTYIPLQADHESCGVVALKMSKHLDNKWYCQHKYELWKQAQPGEVTLLPEESVPKKLLSYKQPDLWKMKEYNSDVFEENFKKGYIKNMITSSNINTGKNNKKNKKKQKIMSDAKNVKLQEFKTRILYRNYYEQEKAKLDKKHPKYREQKQKIIKDIEKKYENNKGDISNSSISSQEEKDLITYL